MKIAKKDIIVLSVVGIVLGFLLIRQFYLSKFTQRIQTGEDNQLMALEIAQLMKANSDLRLEIGDLTTTSTKYQKSLGDKKSATDEVAKNLEKYQIIAGTTRVKGPGVEIRIDGDLEQEQLVDLTNALRNIGTEGISVNNKRFIINSYFKRTADGTFLGDTKLGRPYTISATGNGALIKESLERAGGVIEQIKDSSKDIKITIDIKDEIILNPS